MTRRLNTVLHRASLSAIVAAFDRDMHESRWTFVPIAFQLPPRRARYRNAARHVDAAHAGQFTRGTVRLPAAVHSTAILGPLFLETASTANQTVANGEMWLLDRQSGCLRVAIWVHLKSALPVPAADGFLHQVVRTTFQCDVGSPKDPRRGAEGLPKRGPRMEIWLPAGVSEGLTKHRADL
jgi:hypothetical protein